MRKPSLLLCLGCLAGLLLVSQCSEKHPESQPTPPSISQSVFGGFESPQKWGEHLVTIAACHDCHTPKKVTAQGLELDSSLLLSGHPSHLPPPSIDRKELESKGHVLTPDLTAWIGPWGISYTANLTSDSTGIGTWKEDQFIYAIRNGKYKGLASSRSLLPPMPWQMYRNMSDAELKAIFAYLKSTKPVRNIVPPPVPPALTVAE